MMEDKSEIPKPKLSMVGEDGNAFSIMARASKVARAAGWSDEKIEAYRKEAMDGDYDHLLMVTMEHFDVDSEDEVEEHFCPECGSKFDTTEEAGECCEAAEVIEQYECQECGGTYGNEEDAEDCCRGESHD